MPAAGDVRRCVHVDRLAPARAACARRSRVGASRPAGGCASVDASTRRTSENPLLCDAARRDRDDRRRRRARDAVPTRGRGRRRRRTCPSPRTRPGASRPGSCAVSPPTSSQPASTHPSATPATISAASSGSSCSIAMQSTNDERLGPHSTRRRRRSSRRSPIRPCGAGRPRASSSIFVPVVSVESASTGSVYPRSARSAIEKSPAKPPISTRRPARRVRAASAA